MKAQVKRLLGRGPQFSLNSDGEPSGRLTLSEARELGIATVGRHTYGRVDSPMIQVFPKELPEIRIGSFCMFGPDVLLLTGGRHRIDRVTSFPFRTKWGMHDKPFEEREEWERDSSCLQKTLRIGNEVWVANAATILDGVTIGDGAVIAGGSVVTRDVEPYAMVGGNPARPIRKRFNDEQIAGLIRVAWWEWPDEKIRERIDHLYSQDIDAFLERYSRRCDV